MLYVRRKGWAVDRMEARVRREKVPSKPDTIRLELILGGALTSEQEQPLHEIANRCPVHRALTGQVEIVHG